MRKEVKAFYRGWALLARFIAEDHGEPTMVQDAAQAEGITLAMLEEAEVDCYDLDPLRPIFEEDYKLIGVA